MINLLLLQLVLSLCFIKTNHNIGTSGKGRRGGGGGWKGALCAVIDNIKTAERFLFHASPPPRAYYLVLN